MTNFSDTDAGAEFIASGASRETSPEIMEAIAFFARNGKEADEFWNGDFDGRVDLLSFWENATGNGSREDTDLIWGERSLAQIMAEDA
jgi:hypothetical protein